MISDVCSIAKAFSGLNKRKRRIVSLIGESKRWKGKRWSPLRKAAVP